MDRYGWRVSSAKIRWSQERRTHKLQWSSTVYKNPTFFWVQGLSLSPLFINSLQLTFMRVLYNVKKISSKIACYFIPARKPIFKYISLFYATFIFLQSFFVIPSVQLVIRVLYIFYDTRIRYAVFCFFNYMHFTIWYVSRKS